MINCQTRGQIIITARVQQAEFTSGQSGQDSIQRNRAFKKGIESVQGRPENDIPGKNQQMKGIGGAIKEQRVQSEKGKVRSDFRRP